MKLDDLDEAIKLRNHRAKCLDLRRKAESNPLVVQVGYSGHETEVGSVFSLAPIREAITRECDLFLAENTVALQRIGVEP
jgi:hypothetical protein